MQRLEVSGAVRPIYGSLAVKRLRDSVCFTFFGTAAPRILRVIRPEICNYKRKDESSCACLSRHVGMCTKQR